MLQSLNNVWPRVKIIYFGAMFLYYDVNWYSKGFRERITLQQPRSTILTGMIYDKIIITQWINVSVMMLADDSLYRGA